VRLVEAEELEIGLVGGGPHRRGLAWPPIALSRLCRALENVLRIARQVFPQPAP
jgi:hypothetical protein